MINTLKEPSSSGKRPVTPLLLLPEKFGFQHCGHLEHAPQRVANLDRETLVVRAFQDDIADTVRERTDRLFPKRLTRGDSRAASANADPLV